MDVDAYGVVDSFQTEYVVSEDPSLTFYQYEALLAYATDLFCAAGLPDEKARSVAWVLVEADLIGHTTHGLALVPTYLDALRQGTMAADGEPEVLSDNGSCMAWQGHNLPGGWLTLKALDLCISRVAKHGVVTCALAGGHHIGALAVYMKRATDLGLMAIVASSTPSAKGVAPHGGTQPLFTPNPLAAGIPTNDEPIVLDISASITTMNQAKQLEKAGQKFPHSWAIDNQGVPTDDPAVVVSQGGTLLPVGGIDHGHKGYSMALLVEAMTQGLSGVGRADAPTGTYTSVFIQVLDPAAFGGSAAYMRQTSWLAQACRDNPPRPGIDSVRVPGDRAAQHRNQSLQTGVPLSPAIVTNLVAASEQLGISLPVPLG